MSAVLKNAALEFNRLRHQDLSAVMSIESDAYVFPWTQGNFQDSLSSGYECWACWQDGTLIGYIVLMFVVDEAHLLNLAVAPDHQRQGIGSQLLRFAISLGESHHCELLYLEVRPSNIAARAMYDQFGFQQMGLRRDYYLSIAGREDALFLGLNLTASRPESQ